MARLTVSFLDETDRETLNEQTLTVLEEVGVAYNTPAALDVLEGTEAVLDRERLTARLPRELVARCLETAPRTVLLAARDRAHDVRLGDGGLSFTSDGTATYVLDDESGELHESRAAELRTIMRLFDALPALDYAWATVSPRDLDPRTANLETAAIAFRSCAKHVLTGVRGPQYVAPLLEMIAAADARRRPDRGEHRPGSRRRAPRHHAHAADGHHGADDGGGSDRRGARRAAVGGRALPAGGPIPEALAWAEGMPSMSPPPTYRPSRRRMSTQAREALLTASTGA